MKRVKQITVLGATAAAAFLLYGCPQPVPTPTPSPATSASPTTTVQANDTDICLTCHGDNTELGNKIQNARVGWDNSVHAKGWIAPLKDSTDAIIGHEYEGSDAFYANGTGCQVCHTKEGFNKQVSGAYTATAPAASDSIVAPSNISCFACHKPHSKKTMELVIPPSQAVTTQAGAVYNKSEGSICAQCHQARTSNAEASVISSIKGSGLSYRGAAHHGPETDMLMGKAGAEYAGKTYGNSTHTSLAGATCLACHMTYAPAGKSFSGAPNLAGHSFNVIGMVHGAEKANTNGCATTACHGTAVSAKAVGASGALAAKGHLKTGAAYFAKGTGTQVADEINQLLTTLMNPDSTPPGAGLLQSAYQLPTVGASTHSITWSTDGRFLASGITASVKDSAATATSPKTRFGKAMYNYLYVKEEGSMGVHNTTYTKQLLLDSINDLIDLGATTSATHTVTRP